MSRRKRCDDHVSYGDNIGQVHRNYPGSHGNDMWITSRRSIKKVTSKSLQVATRGIAENLSFGDKLGTLVDLEGKFIFEGQNRLYKNSGGNMLSGSGTLTWKTQNDESFVYKAIWFDKYLEIFEVTRGESFSYFWEKGKLIARIAGRVISDLKNDVKPEMLTKEEGSFLINIPLTEEHRGDIRTYSGSLVALNLEWEIGNFNRNEEFLPECLSSLFGGLQYKFKNELRKWRVEVNEQVMITCVIVTISETERRQKVRFAQKRPQFWDYFASFEGMISLIKILENEIVKYL